MLGIPTPPAAPMTRLLPSSRRGLHLTGLLLALLLALLLSISAAPAASQEPDPGDQTREPQLDQRIVRERVYRMNRHHLQEGMRKRILAAREAKQAAREARRQTGMPSRDFLGHYAQYFDCDEVNASYYRLPPPSTLASMQARTPEGFEFMVKLHQSMTHERIGHENSAAELSEWLERTRALEMQAKQTDLFFNICHAGQAARGTKRMEELLRRERSSACGPSIRWWRSVADAAPHGA